jgi:hypothetical protein
MKLILSLAFSLSLVAQNWGGVGVVSTQTGSPAVNIAICYAHQISDKDNLSLWSYSEYAVTHVQRTPFQVQTTTSTGFLQDVRHVGPLTLFVFVAAGVAQTSTNTGWSLAEGGGVRWRPWANKNWYTVAAFQPIKSSIGGAMNTYVVVIGRSF